VCVSSVRIAAALVLSAGVLAPWLSSGALAQESCLLSQARLPEAAISSFNDHPSYLIDRHPSGGPPLSSEVRRLAASHVGTAAKLVGLAKDAKPEHIVALGIGLAQAAATCAKTHPEHAETIKKLVAESGNVALTAAFAAESSLFAFAPEERPFKPRRLGMGEPPDVTASPSVTDEDRPVTPPADTGEPSISEKLGIGQSGFLYPFTFGAPAGDASGPRRSPLPPFGGGGLVATSGNVVSPTR
jgi:hypothetical protein